MGIFFNQIVLAYLGMGFSIKLAQLAMLPLMSVSQLLVDFEIINVTILIFLIYNWTVLYFGKAVLWNKKHFEVTLCKLIELKLCFLHTAIPAWLMIVYQNTLAFNISCVVTEHFGRVEKCPWSAVLHVDTTLPAVDEFLAVSSIRE